MQNRTMEECKSQWFQALEKKQKQKQKQSEVVPRINNSKDNEKMKGKATAKRKNVEKGLKGRRQYDDNNDDDDDGVASDEDSEGDGETAQSKRHKSSPTDSSSSAPSRLLSMEDPKKLTKKLRSSMPSYLSYNSLTNTVLMPY